MKDFVNFSLKSSLGQDDIFNICTNKLPDFKWRRGDSDSQGLYISGSDINSIGIKIWLSEEPIDISISFRSLQAGYPQREEIKKNTIYRVKYDIAENLGEILKIKDF